MVNCRSTAQHAHAWSDIASTPSDDRMAMASVQLGDALLHLPASFSTQVEARSCCCVLRGVQGNYNLVQAPRQRLASVHRAIADDVSTRSTTSLWTLEWRANKGALAVDGHQIVAGQDGPKPADSGDRGEAAGRFLPQADATSATWCRSQLMQQHRRCTSIQSARASFPQLPAEWKDSVCCSEKFGSNRVHHLARCIHI